MRKIYLLLASIAAFLVIMLASSYDSRAEKKEVSLKPASEYVSYLAVFHSVAVLPEITAPAFTNNFIRLLVFPELGSKAENDVVITVIRGPPKS